MASVFVAALRDQIETLAAAVDGVQPTTVGWVGVKDGAIGIGNEHALAVTVELSVTRPGDGDHATSRCRKWTVTPLKLLAQNEQLGHPLSNLDRT
jgi:hypothetical protein